MSADVLAVRLDADGDVLLTGPAVRALAHGAAARGGQVDVLASPAGAAAARLLPGVRDVLTFDAPWSGYRPPAVDPAALRRLVETVAARRYATAVVFTSFHQSSLPTALLLRTAGVGRVAATSEDYPGSLLDVRHHRPEGLHEVEAALALARAAGFGPPAGDDGRLAVRGPLPDVRALVPAEPYVVVHPGASVPARAPGPEDARAVVAALAGRGHRVVVTGGPQETALGELVAGGGATDLSGRTDLRRLAAVLAGARCVVAGNTGPAHLAAAVGTPVVSLFAPVVPLERWAPWGVPVVVLGDQDAPCRGTRARECPVPGHTCLSGVPAEHVADAVARLADGAGTREGTPRTTPGARAVVA
ncbi:glycosyltransferase family 9 protein [Isoptericola sp. NEAU-Y5]|uniref:Glycosyltransferase family 9 protein n=1 Tax=Isoptericola luteus TaxID=2879484 RepID=A0ABS7ZG42_9MICO|nr:glycosyltransferase family 9 protein [Isoptericola sp. NEAU-Y5]MCA5893978.1 glycosyltransferase family 9 protein [Isoptericola sp. NEAU-Y5]